MNLNKKDWMIVKLELRARTKVSFHQNGHPVAEVPRHEISTVGERESPLH
jgi:hypothetical protein